VPVILEFKVQNRFLEDDLMAYNAIGEIPGTDKPGEIVMLGAHLDSWHMGTGATDDAAGSFVMLEAVRILRAIGARPRRDSGHEGTLANSCILCS
jgi:carboxypeptidase Q